MPDYQRGTPISLWANYVDGNSSPIISGISGVMIDIYRYNSSGMRVYSVQTGTMTQDIVDLNRFFYNYQIPSSAVVTNYVSEYNAMYSGIPIQQTEVYAVIQALSSSGIFIGSVAVSGAIVNISGSGILNANVSISLLGGGPILTSTVTDVSGNYILYLDPNDYMLQASATNYISNNVPKTVPTLVSNFLFGNTTLLDSSCAFANITITDTFLTTNQDTNEQIPMANMKVSLYNTPSTATTINAISVAWTDVSGIFTMLAAPGDYVLRIVGGGPNNTVYDTAYDISVDTAYAPSNVRYLGTSQYNFLI